MIYKNKTQATRDTGLSYLGTIASSSKIEKGLKYGEMTYILYLAPAKLSGHEVCPMRTVECTEACLNESGHNKMDVHKNTINNARIKKTKLFFENRDYFMDWIVDEIETAKRKAENSNMSFSVRLNGTSDLSPEQFKLNGKNILELFPDVKFYDYTKVFNRTRLLDKYPNYDLTYSYTGYNLVQCMELLRTKTGKVAFVFEGKTIPKTWKGFEVKDGDLYDMRHIDEPGVIIALRFKKVRNKIDMKNNPFIIPSDSEFSVY